MSISWSDATLGELVSGDGPVTLRYFDTHPEWSSSSDQAYTTIIAIHGMGFNTNIFKEWVPHLPPETRLLAFNRRGYEGSSAVHISTNEKPGRVESSGRYLIDMLGFMRYAAEKLHVPAKNAKTGTGGIVLLGWSKGCIPLIALLSTIASLPTLTSPPFLLPSSIRPFYPVLESHLLALIFFESPGNSVGLPGPAHYPELAGVPPDQLHSAFGKWLRTTVPADKVYLLDDAAEEGPVAHDMGCHLAETPEGCAKVADKAFRQLPPTIGVGVLYCTDSPHHVRDAGAWIHARLLGKPNAVIRTISGGNHFIMATNPDVFGASVSSILTSLQGRG